MPFHKFNKQCVVIYFIEGLGQIDSAQIHSTNICSMHSFGVGKRWDQQIDGQTPDNYFTFMAVDAWALTPGRGREVTPEGTISSSLLRHVPHRGYNKIQIRVHILTFGLRLHKTHCFKLFPAEINGSGYYHTRNALKPTYSHLRSQNFLGRNPRTPAACPRGTTRTPLTNV